MPFNESNSLQMLTAAKPEINVEDMMHRIRQEILQRKLTIALVHPAAIHLPHISDEAQLPIKQRYELEEFLAYHDEAFIRTAYRALLRREPDENGLSYHLMLLRKGDLTQKQIISGFAASPEGRASGVCVNGLDTIKLPGCFSTATTIETKSEYKLVEFLAFHDEEFVCAAYRGVLHREADPEGYQRYVNGLRQGELSKLEILGYLRYSPEGKSVGTYVKGLRSAFLFRKCFKWPVIGYGMALANYVLRLPTIVKNFERFETYEHFAKRRQTVEMQTVSLAIEAALNKLTDTTRQTLSEDARNRSELVQYINALTAATENAFQSKAPTTQLEALAAQISAQISEQNQSLQSKAPTTQLEALAAQISAQISEQNQSLQSKAPTTQLEALAAQISAQISEQNQSLQSKAPTTQLEALATQISKKLFSLGKAVEVKADGESLTQLTNHLVELVQRKADTAELSVTVSSLAQALLQKADAATVQLETREIQRQILDHKRNILDQQRRITMLLEEARKRLPALISSEQIETMVAEEEHLLDAFYVSFEDRFRGTREDIKQRVAVYLPVIGCAKAGSEIAPILDVGCGRGEWLELLGDSHLVASGIDLNRVMVNQCQELGLKVAGAEAIAHLRTLKANSLGAVTGMHIIEHIPFRRLIALFDEVLRVLRPGGVAIFETPNPENLIVGACNFYYDPTHLNPLPPESMKFVMEARGFGRVEVMRLHPQPESALLREGAPQVQQIVNDLMFGAQDYALVAYKL